MRKRPVIFLFSLTELIVSMAVLSVLMLAMMNFFSAAQNAWTGAVKKNDTYQNAQLVFDIMEKDIQSICYGAEFPFYHKDQNNIGDEDIIAFVSTTPLRPNKDYKIPYFEIKYKANDDTDGWFSRAVTDDQDSSTFDFNSNVDFHDSGDYKEIIPGVVSLKFYCLGTDGSLLATEDYDGWIPPFIRVEMQLMNENDYKTYSNMPSSAQDDFKERNARTFAKTFDLTRYY